ncbi:MAG: glycogen synthase GlgA [Desulfobacteraceae bacterium]|nr:glycogen synthase GlgA [Desulfobacteraceae bacterium]
MKILFCASEASPYAKTGGLADVVGSLPVSLARLGCDVRIFMPLYRSVRERTGTTEPPGRVISIPVGLHEYRAALLEDLTAEGIPIYFLEKDEFFDRSYLYGTPTHGDYEDNAERFIAFSRSAQQLCSSLGWYPSIFHLHDWQTGLMAAYFQLNWRYDPKFYRSGTVFTIHNIAYQGVFPAALFRLTHLPPAAFSMQGIEYWGQCSFLKSGLVYSDYLTTVSPRYAMEIQTADFGYGLEGLLAEHRDNLSGILNGIDTEEWDPATDKALPATYSADDLDGKRKCKQTLCSGLGFSKPDYPLLGMISRLAAQKGFDLLEKMLPDLMKLPINLVILGTGEAAIQENLEQMQSLYPDQLKLLLKFDEAVAHLIEAGSDIFLMPSRYEPCGLNQMYSLRYGTIPVVHATGGLDDSVVDFLDDAQRGTGFKFYRYEPKAFLASIRAALEAYEAKEHWTAIQRRAMSQDFSWDRSAREYIRVYEKVLERKKKLPGRGPDIADV